MGRLFRSIRAKVVLVYILLLILVLQFAGAYSVRAIEQFYLENFRTTVRAQTDLLAAHVEPYLAAYAEKGVPADLGGNLPTLVSRFVSVIGSEVQVIDRNGTILAASFDTGNVVGKKNGYLEVYRALLGTPTETVRNDPGTGDRVQVVAVPVKRGDAVLGAVWVKASLEPMYGVLHRINGILATAGVLAVVLAAVLGAALSRTITRPIQDIIRQTDAMAKGDFTRRVRIYSDDEIGQLGRSFNHLTARLQKALADHEEEREKLASVLANMQDGVVAADSRGRVILVNRRAAHMLGRTEDALLGLPLVECLPFPRDRDPEDGVGAGGAWIVEQEEGAHRPRFLRIAITPIRRGTARRGVIAVLSDVTEQETLERERREFVANVSHELRTPLTTLKSYLEVLQEGVMGDPELGPRFLRVAQNETERMIRLVHDLLQLSKIDSKQWRMEKTPTSLSHLLYQVKEHFQFQADARNIALTLSLADPLPPISLDRDKMLQVFDNLLSNALKYTGPGGTVSVSARADGPWVTVTVTDTGIGIPAEDLPRVFERFYRVDKARSRELGGTGLGLSIAREIVRAHGGEIVIDSEVGRGTTVTVRLPLDEEARAADVGTG